MTGFRQALQNSDFALSAELNLASRANADAVIRQATELQSWVDGIQITDNPYNQVQLSPLAAASLLTQMDIDAIVQLTCRDRNRIALESELLGARALGIESIVLMRGDGKRSSEPNSVFDIDAKELIAIARRLNEPTQEFHIGAVATVFKPVAGWRPTELNAKIDAGAQFIQTQVCFDIDVLRRYVQRLVATKLTWRTNVIVGIATLPSAQSAEWLQKNLRGGVVPDDVVTRMKGARDPEDEGVKLCSEMLQQLAEIPGVTGANLMTPGVTETITAAIQASGVRPLAPLGK